MAHLKFESSNHGLTTYPEGAVVKHEKVLTVISGEQSLSTTYADVTGSSITYTPAPGASYIVYECSFVMHAENPNPIWAFKFFVDGSITKNQDSYSPYEGGAGGEYSSARYGHKLIYSASGWTTPKVVKIQARAWGTSSNTGYLHMSYYDYLTADGSNMGSTNRYTDVITTIFSVM